MESYNKKNLSVAVSQTLDELDVLSGREEVNARIPKILVPYVQNPMQDQDILMNQYLALMNFMETEEISELDARISFYTRLEKLIGEFNVSDMYIKCHIQNQLIRNFYYRMRTMIRRKEFCYVDKALGWQFMFSINKRLEQIKLNIMTSNKFSLLEVEEGFEFVDTINEDNQYCGYFKKKQNRPNDEFPIYEYLGVQSPAPPVRNTHFVAKIRNIVKLYTFVRRGIPTLFSSTLSPLAGFIYRKFPNIFVSPQSDIELVEMEKICTLCQERDAVFMSRDMDNCRIWYEAKVEQLIIQKFDFSRCLRCKVMKDSYFSELQSQGSSHSFMSQPIRNTINEATDTAAERVSERVSEMASSIVDSLKEVFENSHITSTIWLFITNFVSQIVHVMHHPSVLTAVNAFVSLLAQLGIFAITSMDALFTIVTKLFSFFKRPFASSTEPNAGDLDSQSGNEKEVGLTECILGLGSLLISGLCMKYTVNLPPDVNNRSLNLLLGISKGATIANVLFLLSRNVFRLISDVREYIAQLLVPGFEPINRLSSGVELIDGWVLEVVTLHNLSISGSDWKYDASIVDRVYCVHALGQIILQDLFKLAKSCADMDRLRLKIERYMMMASKLHGILIKTGSDPHVRKVPYTLCFAGPPGIGKSFMVKNVALTLLKNEGIPVHTTPICTLNAMSKHWDDCDRQPVLLIDDIFSVETQESLEAQLQTVFNVVTCAQLVPPMADLKDKGMRYAPEIFIMCTNKPFPNINGVDKQALYRRRNKIIHFELSRTRKDDCNHCINNVPLAEADPSEMADFHHLTFYIQHDVIDAGFDFKSTKPYKYPELIAYLKDDFARDRRRAQQIFLNDVEELNSARVNKYVSSAPRLKETYEKFLSDRKAKAAKMYGAQTLHAAITSEPIQHINNMAWSNTAARSIGHSSSTLYSQSGNFRQRYSKLLHAEVTLDSLAVYAKQFDISSFDRFKLPRVLLIQLFLLSDNEDHLREIISYISDPIMLSHLVYRTEISLTNKSGRDLQEALFEAVSQYANCGHSKFMRDELVLEYDSEKKILKGIDIQNVEYVLNNNCKVCIFENFPSVRNVFKTKLLTSSDKLPNFDDLLRSGISDFDLVTPEPMGLKTRFEKCKEYLKSLLPSDWSGLKTILKWGGTLFCVLGSIFAAIWGWKNSMDSEDIVDISQFDAEHEIEETGKLSRLFGYNKTFTQAPLISALTKKMTCEYRTGSEGVQDEDTGAIGVKTFTKLYRKKCMHGDECPSKLGTSLASRREQPVFEIPTFESESKVYTQVPRSGKTRKQVPVVKSAELKSESGANPKWVEILNIVKRNVCYLTDEDRPSIKHACLGLYDRKVLIQRHYWSQLIKSSKPYIYLSCPHKSCEYDNSLGIKVRLEDIKIEWLGSEEGKSNFGIASFPVCVPLFRKITKYIASQHDHDYASQTNCVLFMTNNDLVGQTNIKFCDGNTPVVMSDNGNDRIFLNKYYSYAFYGDGLCGSILFTNNLNRPIIGMHVAGTSSLVKNGYGIAEPLCIESFEDTYHDNSNFEFPRVERFSEPLNQEEVHIRTAIYPIGAVNKELVHNQSGKTQYTRSLLFEKVLPNAVAPNPLTKHDPRLPETDKTPLEAGIEHMGKPVLNFPQRIREIAGDDLSMLLCTKVVPVRPVGLVPLEVAVCGRSDVYGFEPLEWSTSPGFGWNHLKPKGKGGKEWLFDLEVDTQGYILKGLHPELQRILNVEYNLRRSGIAIETVFTDCLKDTCLPIEKCSIPGKTRIFSISPVQFTIAFKQYFLDFTASYMNARFEAEHAIGININSTEWTHLACKLLSNSPHILSGDYKNFGPGLNLDLVKVAFKGIMRWYELHDPDEERMLIRRVLASEIINAVHLGKNILYRVTSGIPSGSPITTPLNSLVNSLYIRCAWLELTREPLSKFYENVVVVTYGDDIIMSVKNEFIDVFNIKSIAAYFAQYDIVFTNDTKGDELISHTTLQEVSFLKHKFVKFADIYLAEPFEESLSKCINWIHRKGDLNKATLANALQCLELGFGLGEEKYNKLCNSVILACRDANIDIDVPIPTWKEVYYRCYELESQSATEQSSSGVEKATEQRAGNVTLTSTDVDATVKTAETKKRWRHFTSSDVVPQHKELTDRWFSVGVYRFSTSNTTNHELMYIALPHQAIYNNGLDPCSTPNALPFTIHKWWRGNMEIKIKMNCNKFQIGQLQFSWWYGADDDRDFALRRNIWSASQGFHHVISLAPNNEITFVVPFKSYEPFINTKVVPGYGAPLGLGRLMCRVLVPMTVVPGQTSICSFSVFVRFFDNEFSGMISGDLDKPVAGELQSQSSLLSVVPAAMKLLDQTLSDPNRDNPPSVIPPAFLVPTASHSWALGTDVVEPIHNLRLSNVGQTHHPDTSQMDSEMTVDNLKQKFGLLSQFKWSKDDVEGKLLYSCPANPCPPKRNLKYLDATNDSPLPLYYIPPVGILSSMYNYWRGELEFRFDFVCSAFHQGIIAAVYVPGIREDATITWLQARNSPLVYFNLDENQSYTWTVPYISSKPFWPRRYAGDHLSDNNYSPSKIFLFVQNPLNPSSTVPSELTVNVYLRGSPSFEVCVPVQPSIGLGNNRRFLLQDQEPYVIALDGHYPYYSGREVYVPHVQIMRRATTSRAVALFTKPDTNRPVIYRTESTSGHASAKRADGSMIRIDFVCFCEDTDSYTGYLAIPLATTVLGTAHWAFARALFANNFKLGEWVVPFVNSGIVYSRDLDTTGNTYNVGNPKWLPRYDNLNSQGGREYAPSNIQCSMSLMQTSHGRFLFGENHNDLKDYCRRYQIYGFVTVPAAAIEPKEGRCAFKIPLLPQGCDLDLGTPTAIDEVWNRCREGQIPIISSGFRFYRGSLRFRIVCPDVSGVNIWIQHKPDRRLSTTMIKSCVNVLTADAVFNHGYAYYVQSLSVNNIVELEIPYYQPGTFGLLQGPIIGNLNRSKYYSLGELSVGFFSQTTTSTTSDLRLSIYYSLGDDMQFTTFQGFPPVILSDDITTQDNFELLDSILESSE